LFTLPFLQKLDMMEDKTPTAQPASTCDPLAFPETEVSSFDTFLTNDNSHSWLLRLRNGTTMTV